MEQIKLVNARAAEVWRSMDFDRTKKAAGAFCSTQSALPPLVHLLAETDEDGAKPLADADLLAIEKVADEQCQHWRDQGDEGNATGRHVADHVVVEVVESEAEDRAEDVEIDDGGCRARWKDFRARCPWRPRSKHWPATLDVAACEQGGMDRPGVHSRSPRGADSGQCFQHGALKLSKGMGDDGKCPGQA